MKTITIAAVERENEEGGKAFMPAQPFPNNRLAVRFVGTHYEVDVPDEAPKAAKKKR